MGANARRQKRDVWRFAVSAAMAGPHSLIRDEGRRFDAARRTGHAERQMSLVAARALPLLRPFRFVLARPTLAAALFFWCTWGETRLVIALSGVAHVPITGHHVHHLVTGTLLLLAAGTLDILKKAPRLRPVLLGVGAALVLDEFALIWNLRDVYWSREGHLSIVVAAAFGIALTVAAGRELVQERRRRGPVRSVSLNPLDQAAALPRPSGAPGPGGSVG